MALSDSPWLLNLNLEWENKADFKLLLNSLYSVEVRPLSLRSAHELEHCNEYFSIFSLSFPWSRESPQCTAYLSYYCALGLADGSRIFFFLCPGHRKICYFLFMLTITGHFANSAAHLAAREEQTHCTFRSFHTMPSFYPECRINHRRKVQLILWNYLKFPSQLSLSFTMFFFILQRQSTWTSSVWIGNTLEFRGHTCFGWVGTYDTFGEGIH